MQIFLQEIQNYFTQQAKKEQKNQQNRSILKQKLISKVKMNKVNVSEQSHHNPIVGNGHQHQVQVNLQMNQGLENDGQNQTIYRAQSVSQNESLNLLSSKDKHCKEQRESLSYESITDHQPVSQSGKEKKEKCSSKIEKQKLTFPAILAHSKLLKSTYIHFCNISYADTRKKTFEQMEKNKETMSLNRFMLFCKQFNIEVIVKFDQKTEKQNKQQMKTQNDENDSNYAIRKNPNQREKIHSKPKMLEIPVKKIDKVEKKLNKLYKSHSSKNQQMTYDQFVNSLLQIHEIFSKNIKQISPLQQFANQDEIHAKFISDVLFINDPSRHKQKMDNLKIQFKGSISYHQQPTRKSEQYLKKSLVIHGGRAPEQMKKELEIYQEAKKKKTENWIDSQSQLMGVYSKSRVFYQPNPSKVNQTNDVIRLARKQAGRTLTQSLFDFHKFKDTLNKQKTQKKEEVTTFSKIFQDKTNKFSDKLQKLKQQTVQRQFDLKLKKLQEKEDEILKQYFENEKRIYGDQNIHPQ